MEKRKFKVSEFVNQRLPWIILVLLICIFSIFSPTFLSISNLTNILNQNSYVLIASYGIALVMMSGQLDLSVGYEMSIIGVTSAMLMTQFHVPTAAVILYAMGLGILICLLNTFLAMKLKLGLMMVSIAAMNIFQGLSYTITESKTYIGFSDSFKFLGQGSVGPIPFAIILALVLFIVMSFFLNKTYMGRYVYALGGNEEASRLAGINVTGVKLMIAALEGLFVGLATVMLISRIGSAQSAIGPGTEFTVITGVLLGGVSVRGGEGRLSGVVGGILIMAVLSNGMQMVGLGTYAQYMVKGAIMLIAIGIDVYQMNRKAKVKKVKA